MSAPPGEANSRTCPSKLPATTVLAPVNVAALVNGAGIVVSRVPVGGWNNVITSPPAAANACRSLENDTVAAVSAVFNVRRSVNCGARHSRTVWSKLPADASVVPSRENANPVTKPVCPVSVRASVKLVVR